MDTEQETNVYKDVKDMSDEELDREIYMLEKAERDRIEAVCELTIRILDRVKILEEKVEFIQHRITDD